MPVGVLAQPQLLQSAANVDIIAVHGIFDIISPSLQGITPSFAWLRQLFPYQALGARVLSYQYDGRRLLEPGQASENKLLHEASTLVADLLGLRQESDAFARPIIFICHGVGGLLVKLALAWSSSHSAVTEERIRSIYGSTYSVVFAGTPHTGISVQSLALLYHQGDAHPNQLVVDLLRGSELLADIADQFAQVSHKLKVLNLWELEDTNAGHLSARIVGEESAAPIDISADRCGLLSNHANLVSFADKNDHGYKVISSALARHIGDLAHGDGPRRNSFSMALRENSRERPRGEEGSIFSQNTVTGGKTHFGNVYIHTNENVDDEYLTAAVPLSARRSPRASPGEAMFASFNEFYNVPRCSSPQFTGRKLQSDLLRERLGDPGRPGADGKHKVAIIYGLGGSGKTQFCLKYVEMNRSSYWGIFWIDASTRENAEAGYAALGSEVGKGATFSAGKWWLSQSNRSWLLVLDNADDPEMDILDFLPTSDTGHIIVTTRNINATIHANVGSLRFRGMDPEEGIRLLLTSAYPHDQTEDVSPQRRSLAASIAAELGYLAISLAHAGTTIRRNIYTLEKYLHFYLGYRHRLLVSPKSISADEANVITTWEIPFRQIEKRHTTRYEDAVTLMYIFAFLHFEAIPQRIFLFSWLSAEQKPSDLPELLRLDSSCCEEAQTRLHRAITTLCEYSVIDHDTTSQTCSLHPVVHSWARTRLSDEKQLSFWLNCTLILLMQSISPYLEASGRAFRRLLLPHLDSCLAILETHNLSFPTTSPMADQVERFASVYAESGKWNQALALQRKVVSYRSRTLGKAHEATLKARRNISQIFWNLFEVKSTVDIQFSILKSRWWFRSSLEAWKRPLKPDHLGYCIALDDLTQTLWLAGQRIWSQTTGERAVCGLLKRLGPEDPLTLNAMFNLGRTYRHLGETTRAHKLLQTVVRMRKRYFGPDHPDTLMSRNELGMSLYTQKIHLPIALRLVSNVYKARQRVLGEEHAYTLWSANDLSRVLCECGKASEAVALLTDVIPIVARTLGDKHVGMNMTQGNLARAYHHCERWADAEPILLRMLEDLERAKDHPDWLDAVTGLARVQMYLGKLDEAERNCQTALQRTVPIKSSTFEDPRRATAKELLEEIEARKRRK